MNSEKVTVIKNWPVLKSVKEIQFFLSFCNFYHNSLKKWDQVIHSLIKLTAKRAWHTLEELEIQIFKKAKKLVLSDTIWVHYSSYAEIRMKTDISDEVVARVLTQLQKNEKWKSAAYFLKTMSSEEMRYEIHDKEMLTVVRALQKWQGMLLNLQAVPFVAITDHCAMKYFITKQLLNSQQARWADIVTDYNFKITYCSEIANIVTDTLTRKHDKLIT